MVETLMRPADSHVKKSSNYFLALVFLSLLLSVDALFILVHCGYTMYRYLFNVPELNKYLLLDFDKGYAEVFQYIKEFWISGILLILSINQREKLFFAWSLLFFYLLLDDSFTIHEKLGYLVSDNLAFSPGLNLRANDFGELMVSAFFGIFLFSLIGFFTYRASRLLKQISFELAVLLGLLVVFGVGVDILHIFLEFVPGSGVLVVVEDGGELVVMSVICWYLFRLLYSFQSDETLFISPLHRLHSWIGKYYPKYANVFIFAPKNK